MPKYAAKKNNGAWWLWPIWAVAFLLGETVFRLFAVGGFLGVYQILFALVRATTVTAGLTLLPKKAGEIVGYVAAGIAYLVYGVQVVYHHIFDAYLSVTQLGMGADAVASFGKETLLGIAGSALPLLLLLLVPGTVVAGTVVCRPYRAFRWQRSALAAGAAAVLWGLTLLTLPLGGKQAYAPCDTYFDTFVLHRSEMQFGPITTLRLELRQMMFPQKAVTILPPDPEPEPEEPAETEYQKNVLAIDFAGLAATETDEETASLHRYFAGRSATSQNAYTGMFRDYNVIELCCESFSPAIIDEKRTPTLYKMATEGFVFSNYYNTVCDNTSNGEYALCTGLLPDTSLLAKGWQAFYEYNSFTASQKNLLPYCLGKRFDRAFAYHNYFGDYYGRNKTHPNMGYTFRYMGRGLKKTEDWPTSDLAMMQQTLPELLQKNEKGEVERFTAYYLTFSGHMYYNFSTNDMAIKNRSVVEDLPYSTAVKAYLACQQELEYALTYLVEQLEAAGVADRTLILLTADHYPYNLTLKKLGEINGNTDYDGEFDKYRGGWLMWSASMTEQIKVDVPCCTLDILPTVTNLLGLPYDSRLMMGTDVFSDGRHIAILEDRGFVTDRVCYNGSTGEAAFSGEPLAEGELDALINDVKNRFTVSTAMLYSDYYRSVFPEDK